MDTNLKILKQVSLFSLLDDHDLLKIASIIKEKSYRKNEIIFHQEDQGNILFILKSGLVKVSLTNKSGKEAILKMVYENEFFGEMSLLDGCFRSATVTAIEDCKVMLIFQDDLIRFLKQHFTIVLNMLATLSRRIRKTDERIASLAFLDSYGKVARIMLDFVENHGKEEGDNIALSLPFSRQEMADIAGISRETLTRILHEFQIRGCLKMNGKNIIILDETILKREVM